MQGAGGWHSVSWLLAMHKALGPRPLPVPQKPPTMVHVYNPGTVEVETERSEVHPGQQNEFEGSLSYTKPCLQINKILTTSIQAKADSVSDTCYSIVAFKDCSGVTSYGEASCWRYTHFCTPCPLHQHTGVSNLCPSSETLPSHLCVSGRDRGFCLWKAGGMGRL